MIFLLRKLWTDLEPDEAPVVLVVGSETETGQVVLRRGGGQFGEQLDNTKVTERHGVKHGSRAVSPCVS